jgi:uroporphyrinogen decarboxylase
MSGNGCIGSREDYEIYKWPDPSLADVGMLDMEWYGGCPDGIKLIVYGAGGILENAVDILGYDQLCYMLYDEPELIQEIFGRIGGLFFEYYKLVVGHHNVGAIIYNDDWGYKTQTIVSPKTLRKSMSKRGN